MPVDLAAFRKLISNRVSPKTCVTRVTRVTASEINHLAGHEVRGACVTCVTDAANGSRSHAVRDEAVHDCVTGKYYSQQILSGAGHAVTRSRTEKREQESSFETAVEVDPFDLEDWLTRYDERASIIEFDGGIDRVEAERRALAETIAAIGPRPTHH